jgi:hypothetical protein
MEPTVGFECGAARPQVRRESFQMPGSLFGNGTWLDIVIRVGSPLLAATILALLRKYWSSVVTRARAFALLLPRPISNALRRSFDRVYPSWRYESGETRGQLSLEWRLEHVRKLRKNRFFIFGPTYLDIFLTPVSVSILTATEVSDLEPVRLDCGGSATYFGRYLFRTYRERSELYTSISVKDDVGREQRSLLKDEPWVSRLETKRLNDVQAAISVHLLQRSGEFHTTFTHRGVASSLSWQPQLKTIRKRTKRGGLLYISGYFRTNLSQELCFSLRQLHPKLVVFLDHGKFRVDEHAGAVPDLVEAFVANLIDVYICTFAELRLIAETAGRPLSPDPPVKSALEKLAAEPFLPRVTIIRDNFSSDGATAYLVLDRSVHVVSMSVEELRTPSRNRNAVRSKDVPGARNAFSAGLAHSLSTEGGGLSLELAAKKAVEAGLKVWIEDAE